MSNEHYWFKAKTYGIGWTVPATWQGWAVVLAFLVLLFVGLPRIDPPSYRLAYIVLLGVILIGVIAWKGEKPFKWRWGRD